MALPRHAFSLDGCKDKKPVKAPCMAPLHEKNENFDINQILVSLAGGSPPLDGSAPELS